MMPECDLVLIDGSSFLYRAFYAARQTLTKSDGTPTGAALILTRMLRNLVRDFAKVPVVAVFDAKGKSFRAEMYAQYKANRPPMPEALQVQISMVHDLVHALGLPLIEVPGVEADDVLGSYAKAAEQAGLKTLICTGDKDLAQLVSDQVTLMDTMQNVVYDAAAVKDKYGVPPALIIDLLALKGDSSDNIPGMSGVGDVTACKLLNSLGGIEQILKRKDEIAALKFRGSKSFAAKFIAQLDTIRLSYKLAKIKTDVPLPIALSDLTAPKPDHEALIKLFKDLEFSRLLKEEEQGSTQVHSKPEPELFKITDKTNTTAPAHFDPKCQDFKAVTTEDELKAWADKINEAGLVALDTETDSLHPAESRLVGMSLCVRAGEAVYIPLGHDYLGAPAQLSLAQVKDVLGPVLADPKIRKIGHNLKFDLLVLYFHGIEVQGVYADTMLEAHLIDSLQSCGLDELCLKYLNYQNITFKEVAGSGASQLTFNQVALDKAMPYAAEDAESAFRLHQAMMPILEAIPYGSELLFKHEMPLMQVLVRMEESGALVSAVKLNEQTKILRAKLAEAEEQVYISCGEHFNIYSPKQLGAVLFERLGIRYPKKPKVGKDGRKSYSTAEEILKLIAHDYDIANLVLRCRALAKLISTYTDKLPQLISARTGRIHTSFNQAGTVTGRLSSSDPNLQNIPARTEEGRLIRKAFIAPAGYTIVSADYSQIELRLIAAAAHDPGLIAAFQQGQDIHRATAASVLGKLPEEITPAERSQAKATNFGLIYGMGAQGLCRQTGMSFKAAQAYIDRYFEHYPKIHQYMHDTIDFCREHGYVETLLHRRINFAAINAQNRIAQKAAERAAINAPMQGGAADIIKLAMIAVQQWIDTLPEGSVRMTLQVHDELVFEIKDELKDEACAKIKSLMEGVTHLEVPLEVGVGAADNWGDAH